MEEKAQARKGFSGMRRILIPVSAVLILIFVFWTACRFSEKIINSSEDAAFLYLFSSTEIIRRSLDRSVAEDLRQLERYAGSIADFDEKRLQESLEIFNKLNGYGETYYANLDGEWISSRGERFYGSQLSVEEIAITQGKAAVSDCFIGDSGRKILTFQAPVMRDNQMVGAVYCEANFQKYYSDELFAFQDGEGRGYVFDARDGSWLLRSPVSPLLYVRDSSVFDTYLRAGNSREVVEELRSAVREKKTGIFLMNGGDENIYLCITPSLQNSNWILMTVLPEKGFLQQEMASAISLKKMTVFFVAGLVLLAVISWLVLKDDDRKRAEAAESKWRQTAENYEKRLSAVIRAEYSFQISVDLANLKCKSEVWDERLDEEWECCSGGYASVFQKLCSHIYLDDTDAFTEALSPQALCECYHQRKCPDPVSYRILLDKKTACFQCTVTFAMMGDRPFAYLLHKEITETARSGGIRC